MGKRHLATSTDYANPYLPLPVRALNFLAGLQGNSGLSRRLNGESMIRRARRKTGLADFGGDGYLPALDTLVRSINEEARLTATGQLIQKARLTSALVQRLRIEELLRRHPEIHDIELGTIILITGLQRTGTTLLHRLVHSHPEIRGISGAEAMEPVPARNATRHGTPVRKLPAALAQHMISYLSPQFSMVHPIDYTEPEEDVMLLDLNFMSQTPEATLHVPAYSRWLECQDHTQTYRYFRKVLKILSWLRPGRHWVLKTPHHMEYLDVVLKVFPEATIVQTHRDPRKALPSFCSMVAHGHGIFSNHVDPLEIGSHWSRKTRRMVEHTMQTRTGHDPGRFEDVSYYDLVRDPVSVLRRIYRRSSIDFSDEAVQVAQRYLEAHPRNRFGRHVYRLDDFGLNEEIIEENFSAYRKKHAIPFE